jgi:hypothetical protein
MEFNKLYDIVLEEVHNISVSNTPNFNNQEIHSLLINNPQIREVLEIVRPIIEDISNLLEVSKGKVFAVRMDKMYGITGFKKPIIASLILKRLIESVKIGKLNRKWIDGGNVNSALALGFYAKKFEGKAANVMSRLFPKYILEYIKEICNDSIRLIKAPNLSLGIERDFYKYLVYLVRNDPVLSSYQPLWHARYSGKYSRFLGLDLANDFNICPEYIISGIGSGSTIEGQAMVVKTKYHDYSKIVVPEHYQSSLLSSFKNTINSFNKIGTKKKEYPLNWFSNPPSAVPHYVLGPHYDEINPLINKHVLNSIDHIFLYNDDDWKQMSYKCYLSGFKIGNSSAANLVAAKYLADKGNTILTFIYEPFRNIYKGHNIS